MHPEVAETMAKVLRETAGNASSLHTPGRTARGLIDTARRSVADLLSCDSDRVFFTSGGTEGNNAVLKGVFDAAGGSGHIITTTIEHESILGACRQIEARGGTVTYIPAGRDGRISANDVRTALRSDTRLISVMHANNETGAIQPIAEVVAIARSAGIPCHSDAVQSFGKIPVRVDDLGVEFLTLTAHKINGPKGAGAIYWRGNTPWLPLICGGDQEHALRAGTEGTHQIAGLGKASALAGGRGEAELARLRVLRRRLIAGLRLLAPNVIINEAPPEAQLPGTVNATFPGITGIRLLAGLDCYGISVSIGSACTADRIEPSHVLLGMGLSTEVALSTIRLSMGSTTTTLDIVYALWALRQVLTGDPAGFSYLDPEHLTEERILSPNSYLIDLRFPHERLLAPSIPQARLMSHIGFERYIPEIPRERDVILMCSTGIFSLGVGYRLAKSGHPSVHVLFGGYAAWRGRYPTLIHQLFRHSS